MRTLCLICRAVNVGFVPACGHTDAQTPIGDEHHDANGEAVELSVWSVVYYWELPDDDGVHLLSPIIVEAEHEDDAWNASAALAIFPEEAATRGDWSIEPIAGPALDDPTLRSAAVEL